MGVSVEKIMELENFSQAATLIAGKTGINNTVTFITVSETPDFYQWVSGGEFVLTTLYALNEHKDLQTLNYMELAKRGVAAIGVKVDRFVKNVPQELIDIANCYHVPLFAIKREAKFREIIQTITAELNNYQTNILLEVEAHYKELKDVALRSGDFSEYIQGLGKRKVSSGIYCFRADLKLLGSYQKPAQSKAVHAVREKLEQYLDRREEVLHPVEYQGLHIFPCVSRQLDLGYLVIVHEDNLSEKHNLMASQLATFLTLKLIDQLDTEQKTLTALLDELLYKRNLSEQDLQGRLALFGLKHQKWYQVIIVQNQDENAESSFAANTIRICCNRIRELQGEIIIINKTTETVIISSSDRQDDTKSPQWIKDLSSGLNANPVAVTIGIGPAVGTASEIRTSYQMAKSTIKAGVVSGRADILYYADYLARNLLLRTIGTPEMEYLLKEIIHPLVEQDKRYNTQILPTIEAMMFADEVEHAAATLFVHANTIRYRLNKIKNITGHDFFTAQGRYVITTAYLVHCYNR